MSFAAICSGRIYYYSQPWQVSFEHSLIYCNKMFLRMYLKTLNGNDQNRYIKRNRKSTDGRPSSNKIVHHRRENLRNKQIASGPEPLAKSRKVSTNLCKKVQRDDIEIKNDFENFIMSENQLKIKQEYESVLVHLKELDSQHNWELEWMNESMLAGGDWGLISDTDESVSSDVALYEIHTDWSISDDDEEEIEEYEVYEIAVNNKVRGDMVDASVQVEEEWDGFEDDLVEENANVIESYSVEKADTVENELEEDVGFKSYEEEEIYLDDDEREIEDKKLVERYKVKETEAVKDERADNRQRK